MLAPTTSSPWHTRLMAGRWYASLPTNLQHQLLALARARTLVAGECLFRRGDAPCGLYVVLDGQLRVSGYGGTHEDTREALLTLLEAPQWFGEIAVFDQQARTHDAQALGPCTLLQVPQQDLLNLLTREPAYWRDLGRLMGHKLRQVFDFAEELVLLPAPQRLAARLLHMSEGYGEWQTGAGLTRRQLAVSQEQLSHMLALTRQTTNKLLRQLAQQQVLHLRRGAIEIIDLPALRHWATHPPQDISTAKPINREPFKNPN